MIRRHAIHQNTWLWSVIGFACASCGVGRVYVGLHSTNNTKSQFVDANGDGIDDSLENISLPSGPISGDTAASGPVITVSPDAPGCGRGDIAPAAQQPVHFMFTLDKSGSMDDSTAATSQNRVTKWVALQQAMEALFDDLGNSAQAGDTPIAVGLDYFSGSGDSTVEQPLKLLDRARATVLMNDIAGVTPGGSTPTEAALTLAYSSLNTYAPTGALANAINVEVFVSDGKPNPDLSYPAAVDDLVTGALSGTGKIHTFSIGIGELNDPDPKYGYDPLFMADIAVKGGTAKNGCDPTNTTDPTKFCHYQITPSVSGANIKNDLIAAFNDIRLSVRSCTLPLSIEDPAHLEPRAVIVVAEKPGEAQRILVNDPTNGWTFDNPSAPTQITLHGDECNTLKNDKTEHVFAILGCACAGGLNYNGGNGSTPERQSEGPITTTDPWNPDWCSYPWVPLAPCVGESCL